MPEIEGWSPPIRYDITIDDKRLVTQQDVDIWQTMELYFGKIRYLVTQLDKLLEECREQVVKVKAE